MRFTRGILVALLALLSIQATAQRLSRRQMMEQVVVLSAKVDSLQNVVSSCVRVSKPVDPSWDKWQDVRYNYGFNTSEQPIFNTVEGVLESTTMLSVRGGKGRWNNSTDKPYTTFVDGGHLFEGWFPI